MNPNRNSRSVLVMIFLLALLLSLISCNVTGENTQASKDSEFQLVVLDYQVTRYGELGHNWQTAWPVLQAAYPSHAACTISADAIDSYDWSEQIITLTTQASVAILDIYEVTSEDCRKNRDKVCLIRLAFVVVYQGKPLYGGIFWIKDYMGAEAFLYPIIYSMITADGRVAFIIRPNNLSSETYSADDWLLIKDKRIEALFAELGKLTK